MQLFKVKLRRKQIITTYSGKGKRATTERREEFIEETYGMLPWATVCSYKERFPEAFAGYEREIAERANPKRQNTVRADRDPVTPKKTVSAPKPKPTPEFTLGGGTYADVINKMAKEAS